MSETETLGDRLRRLRLAQHMTLQQVADVFGIHRGSVSSWETDHTRPDIRKLEKLAEVLRVSQEYLLSGLIDPKEPKRTMRVYDLRAYERKRVVQLASSDLAAKIHKIVHAYDLSDAETVMVLAQFLVDGAQQVIREEDRRDPQALPKDWE